ncbi:hypothetical protein F503_08001 [Ophiostoma piceae UAMH 11346]|uniref:Uncharacterized protein n=1 Tax=Ophiostoma piceae (strain UAMH 11346) TaxID=1262450 RepID=S3D263_OPHP1|nr:hypothetical protein F503_08001 [Ophiostoma piceae UAMH 11346]
MMRYSAAIQCRPSLQSSRSQSFVILADLSIFNAAHTHASMTTVLGKRKKPASAATAAAKSTKTAKPTKSTKSTTTKSTKPTEDTADAADDADAIQDIFRRHFEAQFKPLADVVKKDKKKDKKSRRAKKNDDDDEDDEDDEVAADGKTVVIRENESDDDDDEEEEAERDAEEDDDGGWSGLSGDEEDAGASAAPAIQVIDYSATEPRDDPTTRMSKHERKLYVSSKVPSSFDEVERKQSKQKADVDPSSKQYKDAPEMLADDLALQRLISESHLLAGAFALPSSFSTSAGAAATFGAAGTSASKHSQPFAAGRLRQRTTDLRIQAVANKAKGDGGGDRNNLVTVSNAKESIFTQQKMPMSMRKGIAAAAAARETKRRHEARESGIVLERPQAVVSKKAAKRQRAVDAPAVGLMRGSELKLRDKDIRAIEGPKKTFRGGKGGKGGKRR